MRFGIIGSGFGAVAVAAQLLEHGHHDIRLWERDQQLGGVWRDNTYPGAGCDVPSPLYSFSFDVNRTWKRRYALQPEIHAYLRRVAEKRGIAARIRFGHEVVAARWREDDQNWSVTFADGATDEVDVVISAVGQLSEPRLPAIEGLDTFAGDWFHSARWRHDLDLRGRRIAAIGIGASAIQYVPHLADQAASLTLFQRSANYILPKPDTALPRWYRPMIWAERPFWWMFGEQFSRGLDEDSLAGRIIARVARGQLRRQVSDPALRERLTPDYPVGCKRILFSNDFYPALGRDHVTVTDAAVERIVAEGVVTADGRLHEADTVVFGTGFATQDFVNSIAITGREGTDLATLWSEGAFAHLGMYVPQFPNLFLAYGPNTNLGGGSIIYMLEAQARHMRQTADRLRAGGHRTVEVRADVARDFDEQTQERLARSVWGDCDSWYRHPSGRITSNWPGSTAPYARRTKQLDPGEFAWR